MEHERATWIGAGISRPDAVDKVRGEARFADDLTFPGMLHGAVVRSRYPHARVLRIDPSAALGDPSVVCVITREDVPGKNVVHVVYDDQPALATDVVRYVGEPIALVAATSRRAARRAADAVFVEVEELPSVSDPLVALLPDAPVVADPAAAEGEGNVFNALVLRKGDTQRGFADADVVIEGEYETGYQEHAYIEPQGAIAVPDDLGSMTIYASAQCPFYVQEAVANVLGLPLSKTRVIQTATGGAFGGKEDVPSLVASLAALLARATRRPVKLVFDRDEDALTTSKRHPSRVRYRTGAKADGTLTAIDVDVILNAGAYQTLSSAVLWRSLCTAAGPYRIPNVRVDARSVATNTVPNGAFRGFGSPQVIFPHESQMDRLAERLGIDRAEIRRRNLLRSGDRTSTDQVVGESVGVLETLERAIEMAGWGERLARVEAFNAEASRRTRRGVGLSCVIYGVGLGGKAPFLDKAGATMKLEADGSVVVAVGTVEMGQGLTTVMLQVAAESLGVPIDRIQMAPVDTSRVPDSGPTVASRGTMMSGLAILDAARKLRERIDAVARDLGIPLDQVSERLPEIGKAFWLRNLDPAVEGWAQTEPVNWDPETGLGDVYPVYAYATHVAEVEVDGTTGETHVVDFVAVHDSGRILNRTLASGQVQGGIAQGIGFALTEEIPQHEGRLAVNGLTTYRIPTIQDVAPKTTVGFVEDVFPAGPFGAKGIGEVPLMAAHAAVARAVAHAVGQSPTWYPLTPETVRALIDEAQAA